MNQIEHRYQDKYESVILTKDQWMKVIEKTENAADRDLYMYILRSWANQQVVTSASINAFRGKVIEDAKDKNSGSNAISNISRFVRSVTNNPNATCCEWNYIKSEWSIGNFQLFSLRLAFGKRRAPKVRAAE